MNLLGTDLYRNRLSASLRDAKYSVGVVSAFLTSEGVEWICNNLADSVKARFLCRWRLGDLVSGASDLEVLDILSAREYELFALEDVHAKLVMIDDSSIFVGSANVTNSGLKLVPGGNREIGVKFDADDEDKKIVDSFFQEGTKIGPDLFTQMRREVEQAAANYAKPVKASWSSSILGQLERNVGRLWVEEMLQSSSPSELLEPRPWTPEMTHDAKLLGLDLTSDLELKSIQRQFERSRAYRWLLSELERSESNELYFGNLTTLLHDAFLDNPEPYRRTVKELLVNLLNWVVELGVQAVTTDRPNYSQRVRLLVT